MLNFFNFTLTVSLQIFLLICSFFLVKNSTFENIQTEKLIDISSLNFDNGDKHNLNYNWLFYWEQIPIDSLGNYNSNLLKNGNLITINSKNWTSLGYPEKGYGTYRIKIKTALDQPKLMLRIQKINTSCEVWINGKRIEVPGKFGLNKKEAFADTRPVYIPLPEDVFIDLMILTSNYHHIKGGGLISSISLSNEKTILKNKNQSSLVDSFFSFLFILLSIASFIYFLLNRNYIVSFYTFLFCLSFGARQLFVNEVIIYYFFPDIGFSTLIIFQYLSLFLGTPAIILYYKKILPKEFIGWVAKAAVIISSLSIVYIFLAPIYYATFAPLFYVPFALIMIVYVFFVVIKAYLRQRRFSKIIMISTLFAGAIFTTEFIFSINLNYSKSFLSSIGALFIIFIQIYLNYKIVKLDRIKLNKLSKKVSSLNTEILVTKKELASVSSDTYVLLKEKKHLYKKLEEIYINNKDNSLNDLISQIKLSSSDDEKKIILLKNLKEIDQNFILKLRNKHKNLSKTELEISSLIRIGLTSQEIADLRNTTLEAVKKTRFRLKKKLKIGHERLVDYFKEI